MSDNKDYIDIYREAGNKSGDPYLDEIHKAVSEKNYKALLQSDIAAYNLKANTKKYLDQTLANQGLNTQGYGTTAHVGADNAVMNIYAQNRQNYNEAENAALAEASVRRETAERESDNQLATLLQGYSDGTKESLDQYMGNYGYVQGGDGKWYRKDDKGNADLSQPATDYIQSLYGYASRGTASSAYSNIDASTKSGSDALSLLQSASVYSTVDRNGYASVDGLSRAVVGAQDNSQSFELGGVVGDELNLLREYIADNGSSADGTLFKLERGNGYHEAYLVLYAGGRFYVVSSDDREEAGYPVSETYNSYAGNKVTFKGSKRE